MRRKNPEDEESSRNNVLRSHDIGFVMCDIDNPGYHGDSEGYDLF